MRNAPLIWTAALTVRRWSPSETDSIRSRRLRAMYVDTHAAADGDDKRIAMTIANTARALDISRTTVWRLIKSGELQTATIGRRRLVLVASIKVLLRPEQAAGAA